MGKRYVVEEVESNSGCSGCLSVIGLITVLFFLGTCLAAMSK